VIRKQILVSRPQHDERADQADKEHQITGEKEPDGDPSGGKGIGRVLRDGNGLCHVVRDAFAAIRNTAVPAVRAMRSVKSISGAENYTSRFEH
jgi:hypothetical protein